jgi:formylglycine-generating enzyme
MRPAAWAAVGIGVLVTIGAAAFVAPRLTARNPRPPRDAVGDAGPADAAASASATAASTATSAAAPEKGAPGKRRKSTPPSDTLPATLEEQRRELFRTMADELDLPQDMLENVRGIVEASPLMGQGNPKVSKHPMTRSQCRAIREEKGIEPVFDRRCGKKHMVPIFDPGAGETRETARVCIDQFEFPGIPCEYPLVYARASDVVALCRAMGKRICDAHEWEGACAGALKKPETEYAWGKPRPYATWLHNKGREVVWAYGPKKRHASCATAADKSPTCVAGGWTLCGTNSYPAGAFPECVSPFGVYDQHGNAAEHMNLPLAPEELSSRGATGATEMKGSWFVFLRQEAHEDDCRWRAKDWHPSRVDDVESHRNYHLGFRCCADVPSP